MEIFSLAASAVSVLVALGAVTISRIYYPRTSDLVHKNERTAHVLEKSVDQVYVLLNKLSSETEAAYGKIESGVDQLADAANQTYPSKSEPSEDAADLAALPLMNGKHH